MLISYLLGVVALLYGFGEVIVLYMLPGSIVPYVTGSGLPTFGLWFFLVVLILGGSAGLLIGISIWLRRVPALRITALVVTLLAAIASIIDLVPATLNPLGIIWIDVLFIAMFVCHSLYVWIDEYGLSKKPGTDYGYK